MSTVTVWREERCPDCHALRDVQYVRRAMAVGEPIVRGHGWHVVGRQGCWKIVETRTGYAELCDCDAAGGLS